MDQVSNSTITMTITKNVHFILLYLTYFIAKIQNGKQQKNIIIRKLVKVTQIQKQKLHLGTVHYIIAYHLDVSLQYVCFNS